MAARIAVRLRAVIFGQKYLPQVEIAHGIRPNIGLNFRSANA
jgi:hypothetical protein